MTNRLIWVKEKVGRERRMNPIAALIAGIVAAAAFPVAVIIAHRQREKMRNRRAGKRKTQKIKL